MYVLDNVKKTYKSKKSSDTVALNGVSLKLPNKGLVFIVGESGSGKSTLLNVLGCLDSVDEGSILFNGKDISKFSEKEMDSYRNTCVGFVFQDYNVLEQYNVRDNILLSLKLQQKSDIDNSVDKMLNSLGLNGLGDRKINELSGGQKQRVAIARALIKNPKVILADEPTGNLDSESSTQIFELLKNISKDRLVVIVSHNNEAASMYGDRVIRIKDGIVVNDTNIVDFVENIEDIDYKKTKLGFKDALKLSFHNIGKKKGRFVLTVILSAFAVLFMVITFNIFVFDQNKYIHKVMIDNEEKYLEIHNEDCYPSNSGIMCSLIPFSDSELEDLKKDIDVPSGVMYSLNNDGEEVNFIYKELEYAHGYYNYRYVRVVEILDDGVLGELIGKVPSNNREVVVSEGIADRILFSGIKTSDGDFYKPSSFEELLNSDKYFPLGPTEVKIVGISLENDDEFNEAKKTNFIALELEQYYNGDSFKNIDLIYVKGFVNDVNLEFSAETFLDGVSIYGNNYLVKNKEYITGPVTYYNFDGEAVTDALKYNEVILSIDSMEFGYGFENEITNFMIDNPNLTYSEALVEYTKATIIGNNKVKNLKVHFNINQYLKDELEISYFNVVGFSATSVSYISPELFNSIKDPNRYVYGLRLYVDDSDKLMNFINNYSLQDRDYSVGSKSVINMKDRSYITWVIDIYDFIHKYVFYIAIVFIVFMILLIYNFIVTTIEVGKKDIGILKALGANNLDVNKIFASEIMILSILGWILGIILFFITLYLVNTNNILVLYMKLDPLTLEVISLIYSLLFIFVVSLFLSLISIDRVTKIKPIDAILDK